MVHKINKVRLEALGIPLNDLQIMESIATAIITTDLEGTVYTFNKAAEDIFGVSKSEAIGIKYYKGLAPGEEERLQKLFFHVVRTGKTFCGQDIIFVNKGGGKLVVNPHVSLIKDLDGNSVGVVMVVEDVTEKRRMEKILQRKERLEALGEMAVGIAHELRNPLSSIKGFTSLVKANNNLSDDSQKLLDIVIKEADRISRISLELLNTAKLSELGKFVPLQINDILEQTLELFIDECRADDIKLELDLQQNLPLVIGEPERIKIVFSSLLNNARQALFNGGFIRVTTGLDGNWIAIKIADSGIGIDDKVINNIFDPFYSTKEQGSGLGLAIAHSIISHHMGHIEVESQPGKGSTFTVKLPAKDKMKMLQ